MTLKLNGVTKCFGDAKILSDFSCSFPEKGLYFIKGDSGVGKTTLLRIIAGLDTDFDGKVENGGIGNVSFMFQEYRLFPTLSAIKNVAIASSSNSTKEAQLLLTRLGFTDEDMKKKPHALSGGMKQRVAFARSILKNAPILILDEPTKELDADTVKVMLDMIVEESRRRLVIAVTHDDTSQILDNAKIISLR